MPISVRWETEFEAFAKHHGYFQCTACGHWVLGSREWNGGLCMYPECGRAVAAPASLMAVKTNGDLQMLWDSRPANWRELASV